MVSFFFLSSPAHPGMISLAASFYGILICALAMISSMLEVHLVVLGIGDWFISICLDIYTWPYFGLALFLLMCLCIGAVLTIYLLPRRFMVHTVDVSVQTEFQVTCSTTSMPDCLYISRRGVCFTSKRTAPKTGPRISPQYGGVKPVADIFEVSLILRELHFLRLRLW